MLWSQLNLRIASCVACAVLSLTPLMDFAQTGQASDTLPPPVVNEQALVEKDVPPVRYASGVYSVPPRSLMDQRLHESVYPAEAEIRCMFGSTCELGLSRGFVLGADLGSMLGQPLFGPVLRPGRWLVFDGFVGFQFLNAVDESVFFNMSLGYRHLDHKDSDERQASSSGFTFSVSYGQQILDFYSQGVLLKGFYSNNKVENVGVEFATTSANDDKDFIDEFYTFTQAYPRFRFSFPADFEIINWRNTHIDLPNHLRGYVRVEPFLIQNQFKEIFPEINEYTFTEHNVGTRIAYMMSYVSRHEGASRIGWFGGLGGDIQAATSETDYSNREEDFTVLLPERDLFNFYWELGASYQF